MWRLGVHGVAILGAYLFTLWAPGSPAAAQSGRAGHSPSVAAAEHATSGEEPEHEPEDEAEEPPLSLGLDLVIGFGKTPAVTPPAAAESTSVTSESLLISAGYEIAEHLGVGVRMPLTLGSLQPEGEASRSLFALGNLELEGEYALPVAHEAHFVFSLGVALPLAQGEEVEEGEPDRPPLLLEGSPDDYDRGALQRAAASSRGFEDNALFEPGRLGIIPKLGFDYRSGPVRLQPYVKLENLISTRSGAAHAYLAELILGTSLGFALGDYFVVGMRIWTNLALAGAGESIAALEPQLAVRVAHFQLLVGGIWPFAGALTDPQFGGIRIALSLRL